MAEFSEATIKERIIRDYIKDLRKRSYPKTEWISANYPHLSQHGLGYMKGQSEGFKIIAKELTKILKNKQS